MKVTSIIRTYKRIDYLKECLLSISCQTHEDWELIVFDDSGDVEVHKVVEIFKKSHENKRIVYITSFTSYDLFMKSFFYQDSLSEGDIIFRIDDDDILPNYTFEKLVKMYSDNENIDFSFGSCGVFEDESKKITGLFYNKSPLEYKTKNAWAPYTIPDNNPWREPWMWYTNYYESEQPMTSIIHASKANQMCVLQSYSFRRKSLKSVDISRISLPLSTLCDDLEFISSLEYLGLTYAVVKDILTFTRQHKSFKITNPNTIAKSGLNWPDELTRVRDKVEILRPNNFITSNVIVGEPIHDIDSLQILFDKTIFGMSEKNNNFLNLKLSIFA
jgi:glycosyltransferase involved in cell wall biosynthesis